MNEFLADYFVTVLFVIFILIVYDEVNTCD